MLQRGGPVMTTLHATPRARSAARLLRSAVALVLASGLIVVVDSVAPQVANATPCDAPVVNKVACENTKAGARRLAGARAGRLDRRLHHGHQRGPRWPGGLQGADLRHVVPAGHLPAGLLRGQGRAVRGVGVGTAELRAGPAAVPARRSDRVDRLRQLGGVGELERARRTPSPASTTPAVRATTPGRERDRVRRPRRREHLEDPVPDLRLDLGGLQPVRRQQPVLR